MKAPYSVGRRILDRGPDYEVQLTVDGPGAGFGPHTLMLWPNHWFADERQAKAAADMCNTAYKAGYARAQRDIQEALGILTGA